MRKDIKIDPLLGDIGTNVKVEGLVAAGYYLELFEIKSNNVIFEYSGNNVHDSDDFRWLPNSAEKNIGRVLMLDTTIASLNDEVEEKEEYSISLQIYQNGDIVDEAIYKGKLEKHTQSSLIIVKLI